MQVGAIGTSFSPYIYNTNRVSSASLNKVSAIGDDLLKTKTDFSDMSTKETTNPLKMGESLDFMGILGMQMQMSRMNASRFMKEPDKSDATAEITQAAGVAEQAQEQPDVESLEASAMKVATTEGVASDLTASTLANPVSAGAVSGVASSIDATANSSAEASSSVNPYDFARMMAAYQPFEMYA